jgi:hypothetical protein
MGKQGPSREPTPADTTVPWDTYMAQSTTRRPCTALPPGERSTLFGHPSSPSRPPEGGQPLISGALQPDGLGRAVTKVKTTRLLSEYETSRPCYNSALPRNTGNTCIDKNLLCAVQQMVTTVVTQALEITGVTAAITPTVTVLYTSVPNPPRFTVPYQNQARTTLYFQQPQL